MMEPKLLDELAKLLKLLEVPGLFLAGAVIYFLFKALDKAEERRATKDSQMTDVLVTLASGYEKLSTLIEVLVKRQ